MPATPQTTVAELEDDSNGGCPPDCGHTEAEHEAFDAGVVAGRTGMPEETCPHKVAFSDLREAWLTGYSVGALDRRYSGASNLPPGEVFCSKCGRRSEIAGKQKEGLCLSCVIDSNTTGEGEVKSDGDLS